jgi:hypothetical protein
LQERYFAIQGTSTGSRPGHERQRVIWQQLSKFRSWVPETLPSIEPTFPIKNYELAFNKIGPELHEALLRELISFCILMVVNVFKENNDNSQDLLQYLQVVDAKELNMATGQYFASVRSI